MAKVVCNNRYGSFTLSRAAVLRARELSGDPHWNSPCIAGDLYQSGAVMRSDYGSLSTDIARHDPILVQVVEELGEAASGACSKLLLEEVPSGTGYRIDDYDGYESVHTANDYAWTVAP